VKVGFGTKTPRLRSSKAERERVWTQNGFIIRGSRCKGEGNHLVFVTDRG